MFALDDPWHKDDNTRAPTQTHAGTELSLWVQQKKNGEKKQLVGPRLAPTASGSLQRKNLNFRWRFHFFSSISWIRGGAKRGEGVKTASGCHCGALSYVVGNFESVCNPFERIRFLLSRASPHRQSLLSPHLLPPFPSPPLSLVVCVFIFSHVLLCYGCSSCFSNWLPRQRFARDLNLLSKILLKSLYARLTESVWRPWMGAKMYSRTGGMCRVHLKCCL